MIRTMWGDLHKREEGMSVFEVVLASFVLFFVLTAVLGLVGTSTRMNLDSKARAAMTNAVSSHVEWVRSLDFDKIAMSGSGDGVLQPSYTYTIDRFTVTITNSISSGTGGTKEIQITASAAAEGYPTVEMTTFTAIRNTANDENYDDEGPGAGPKIVIGTQTPPVDTVVYGSYVIGGSALYVSASAEAQGEATVSEFAFYATTVEGSEPLRDGATIFAPVAYWTPGTATVDKTFRWDTRQVNEQGQSVIEDGYRTVSIVAIDSEGQQSSLSRRFYVDNHEPDAPGAGPVGAVESSSRTRVSWPQAMDGTDPTLKYQLKILQLGMDGSTYEAGTYIVNDPAYIQTTSPFTRYIPAVRSGTPRNLWSGWVDGPIYTSRTDAFGTSNTWFVGRNNSRVSYTDVSVHVTPPNFETSSIRYDLYRGLNADTISSGAAYQTDIGPSFTENITKAVGKFGTPDPYYYQYKITYTATGPGGGTPETMWSNVIGPTSMNGTVVMEHVRW